MTTSVTRAAPREYPPGECAPYPFDAKPVETSNPALPLATKYKTRPGAKSAEHLRNDVRHQFLVRKTPARPKADGNRRIYVAPGDMADGEGHGQGSVQRPAQHPETRFPNPEKPRPARRYRSRPEQARKSQEFSTQFFSHHFVLSFFWFFSVVMPSGSANRKPNAMQNSL